MDQTIHPVADVTVLGLKLDSKLRWKAHAQAVKQKMTAQMYALQRTTASTWGASMLKARQIYLSVIRSAIAYGAAHWHQPAKPADRPKGLAAKFQKHQNDRLWATLGAFKATPIRQLETEAYIPPLDLWLNGLVACFQARLERSGMAQKIRNACSQIRSKIRTQVHRQRPAHSPATPGDARKQWAEKWVGMTLNLWGEREKKLVTRDWEERWKAENKRLGRNLQPSTDSGGRKTVCTDTPPTRRVLGLHKDLHKAESALLTQIRTGRIGLAKFLYSRRVPGFTTGCCQCSGGFETPRYMALFCPQEATCRNQLKDPAGRAVPYALLTGTNIGAKTFTKWIMLSGRLGQFSLAKRLLYASFSGE